MTNNQLADLLEEAARRLRDLPAILSPEGKRWVTAEQYAALKGLHIVSVRRICRRGKEIVARKEHKSWMIDLERTDKLLNIKGGNTIVKGLAGVRISKLGRAK